MSAGLQHNSDVIDLALGAASPPGISSFPDTPADDPEDILSTSLETLYAHTPIAHSAPGGNFIFTPPEGGAPISLHTPATQAANWALHADAVWAAALFLGAHLDELALRPPPPGSAPLRVLELGAAAGLPSIALARRFTDGEIAVTASDYPDALLMRTLGANIAQNGVSARVRAVPYAWGADPAVLLAGTGADMGKDGFDMVIAADTLWNSALHDLFVGTLSATLRRSADARVHLVAGLHTGRYTLQAFMRAAEGAGFGFEHIQERRVAGGGGGDDDRREGREWAVEREGEDEAERRRWVVWMILRWEERILV